MVHNNRQQISLILLFLFIIFPLIAVAVSFESVEPKWTNNLEQPIIINGNGVGANDTPPGPPRWIFLVDSAGGIIGSAAATGDPFAIIINPTALVAGTNEVSIVDCPIGGNPTTGGDTAPETHWIYYNNAPATTTNILANPDPVTQGQVLDITISMDQTMKKTPLTITITDTNNAIHLVDIADVTFDSAVTDPHWTSLDLAWTVPLDAGVGVANISIIAETATGIATILPDEGAFSIRTAISGNPILRRPAADDSIGGGNETVISIRPQFEWTAVSGGEYTYIEFWEADTIGVAPPAPPAAPNFSVEATGNPFKLNIDLTDRHTYTWRVVVVDAGGGKMTSPVSNRVTVDLRPLRILSPEAGAPKNITQWPPTDNVLCSKAFRDPETNYTDTGFPGTEDHRYQAWEYIFDMSQDPTFSGGIMNTIDPVTGREPVNIFVTPQQIVDQLAIENILPENIPEGLWFIRFRTRDNKWPQSSLDPDYANVNSTAIRTIEIDNTPPIPPGLIFPLDGDPFYFTSETMPTFVWSKEDDAAQFAIELASDDQFTTFYTNNCMTQDVGTSFTSESYTPTSPLPSNVAIYWRVKTIDHAGNISFVPDGQAPIPFRKLYIDTVPPDGSNITLLSPENNMLINDYTPIIDWKWNENVADDPADGIEMDKSIIEYYRIDDAHSWPATGWGHDAFHGSLTVESSRTIPPWDITAPHIGNLFSWEADLPFTPNFSYYWRVKPIDQAGNIGSASTVWRFYLGQTSNSLPPPVIKKPENNEVVKTKTIPLEVKIFPPPLILGQPVRTYHVNVYAVLHDIGSITTDDIKKLAGPIPVAPGKDTVSITATLGEADGKYVLIATVVDDAGTESNPSNSIPTRIILDRESPQIDHLTITSDHEGTTSSPDEGISSRILVQVVFSEEMKLKDADNKTIHPDIYIYPEKGLYSIKVEPYEVPKESWGETAKVWNGIAVIPVGKGYDGKASVSITGMMTDLAGRRLTPNPTYFADHFVIDTAPLMKIKAFYNPVDERDIIISLESSEKLRTVPLVEVDYNGLVSPIRMNSVYDQIHTGVFTTPKDITGVVSITAYAVDLLGNTGIEKYSFRVVSIDPYEGYNVTYPNDFSFKISSGTFSGKTSMVVMPKKLNMGSRSESESKIMEKVSGAYFPTSGTELIPIKENAYDIGPYSLEFKKPVSIEFDVSDVARSNQIGILNYRGGKWHYVPSFKMGDLLVGAYKSSGIYAVMGDSREPRIIEISPGEGEMLSSDLDQIEIEFEETGSGIDVDNVEVILDNVRMKVNVTGNMITYKPTSSLKTGEHTLSVRISDNFGNASSKLSQKFYAPKAFEVYDYYFYPNPSADTDPVIHYTLTQDSTEVYIKIYDISNQFVTTIDNLPVFAGENQSVTWNRMNDELDYVANGVYYAKIIAKGNNGIVSEKIFKVVVLK